MGVVARKTALVLSGGGISGVMLEAGFVKRLRRAAVWDSLAVVYGTSAGAMVGAMACLDRIEELEAFLLDLEPSDVFEPCSLLSLPLMGTHRYQLPKTVEDRFGPVSSLCRDLKHAEVELCVVVSDVTPDWRSTASHHLGEALFSSWRHDEDIFAEALLASAAIPLLVAPLRVGDRVGTDGSWVRNFPLTYAYADARVEEIVSFRIDTPEPRFSPYRVERLASHLRRFRHLPPAGRLASDVEEALARSAWGGSVTAFEALARLMQMSIARNTMLEEHRVQENDQALAELEDLRRRALEAAAGRGILARIGARKRRQALEEAFEAANFPFQRYRKLRRLACSATPEVHLESYRKRPWGREEKLRLMRQGYLVADRALSDTESRDRGLSSM
jgi:predicted acylesterase/phospholipase RssA